MDHGPAVQYEEHEEVVAYKSKVGIKLFFVYALVYAVFIIINTVSPTTMDIKVIFGINLASFYGFTLIILAIIMGLIYNSICSKKEDEYEADKGDNK